MQRCLWMRPALQKSEAVLLPALQRIIAEPQFSDPYHYISSFENSFIPIQEDEMSPVSETTSTTDLSTFVRPRGSMAGRSILRAVGVSENPYLWSNNRPTYYQKSDRQHHAAKRRLHSWDLASKG